MPSTTIEWTHVKDSKPKEGTIVYVMSAAGEIHTVGYFGSLPSEYDESIADSYVSLDSGENCPDEMLIYSFHEYPNWCYAPDSVLVSMDSALTSLLQYYKK